MISLPFCSNKQTERDDIFAGNFSASAEFFCFVGVISFLVCLLAVPAYVLFNSFFVKGTLMSKFVSQIHSSKLSIGNHRNRIRSAYSYIDWQDFVGSAVWTIVWFIASTAWADNVSKLIAYMDPDNLIAELGPEFCPEGRCRARRAGDTSNLVVSAVSPSLIIMSQPLDSVACCTRLHCSYLGSWTWEQRPPLSGSCSRRQTGLRTRMREIWEIPRQTLTSHTPIQVRLQTSPPPPSLPSLLPSSSVHSFRLTQCLPPQWAAWTNQISGLSLMNGTDTNSIIVMVTINLSMIAELSALYSWCFSVGRLPDSWVQQQSKSANDTHRWYAVIVRQHRSAGLLWQQSDGVLNSRVDFSGLATPIRHLGHAHNTSWPCP